MNGQPPTPMPAFPVWARLGLVAWFLTAAASSWTGYGPFARNWVPFAGWTLGLSCFWFWFRHHPQYTLCGLPMNRWAWLAPLAGIFLWPHLVLQEMSYSLDLVALVAIGLGIVLWFAGLFTLSLGPFGIALRRAACLLPPALLVLFFLYGENMVGGGISRMLVASLFLMAWGTGLLLLLAKDNQNPLRQILCEPINLMTNLGLGMVVLSWVWMTDDREVNTRILGLSIWVLIVQGLSRWLAHREGASLGRLSYLMMSRIYRRLGWLAAAAYWLLPDVEAVMALVLLPLLLLFALLAVLAAAAPLRTLHLVLVGLYLTSALAFYWQEIPLVATLRLPGLLLLASALLTFVLLFQNNRLALAPSGKEGSSH